jgi:hypothetical protein
MTNDGGGGGGGGGGGVRWPFRTVPNPTKSSVKMKAFICIKHTDNFWAIPGRYRQRDRIGFIGQILEEGIKKPLSWQISLMAIQTR